MGELLRPDCENRRHGSRRGNTVISIRMESGCVCVCVCVRERVGVCAQGLLRPHTGESDLDFGAEGLCVLQFGGAPACPDGEGPVWP